METVKKCIGCSEPINPLRLKALPKTHTCVDCSTTGAKKAISAQFGTKDNTWNDVVFLEPEEYERYKKISNLSSKFDTIEDEEEEEL